MIFSGENKKAKMALAERVDILSAQASTLNRGLLGE
jgi:hypothetical protein